MSGEKVEPKRLSFVGQLIQEVVTARDGSVEIRRHLDLSEAALQQRGLSRQGIVQSVFSSRMRPVRGLSGS